MAPSVQYLQPVRYMYAGLDLELGSEGGRTFREQELRAFVAMSPMVKL